MNSPRSGMSRFGVFAKSLRLPRRPPSPLLLGQVWPWLQPVGLTAWMVRLGVRLWVRLRALGLMFGCGDGRRGYYLVPTLRLECLYLGLRGKGNAPLLMLFLARHAPHYFHQRWPFRCHGCSICGCLCLLFIRDWCLRWHSRSAHHDRGDWGRKVVRTSQLRAWVVTHGTQNVSTCTNSLQAEVPFWPLYLPNVSGLILP